jgi:hypothetical protein
MLKIVDKEGNTIAVLKDDDNAPKLVKKECCGECKKKKESIRSKKRETWTVLSVLSVALNGSKR